MKKSELTKIILEAMTAPAAKAPATQNAAAKRLSTATKASSSVTSANLGIKDRVSAKEGFKVWINGTSLQPTTGADPKKVKMSKQGIVDAIKLALTELGWE